MALFKPFRGTRASLDTQALHDGYAYFCTDDGSFHIDYVDADGNLHRKQINAKDAETLTGYTFEQIIEAANVNTLNQDAVVLHEAQIYTDAAIEDVKAYVDSAVSGGVDADHTHDDIYYTETEIDAKLDAKADASHTHSWNDLTDKPFGDDDDIKTLDEKYIPDTIARVSDIPQADWNQTDETQNDYIKNKPDILTEEDVIKLIEDNGGGGGSGSTPENLAPVATSGSFNDLIHKPSVVLSLNSEGVLCMNVIYSYDETGATAYNKEEDNETGLSIEQAASVVANNNELEVN